MPFHSSIGFLMARIIAKSPRRAQVSTRSIAFPVFEGAGGALGVDWKAELAVDADESLDEQPVARVERRRVVVAPEKAERREPDGPRYVFRRKPFWRLRNATLRHRPRQDDVRNDRRAASVPDDSPFRHHVEKRATCGGRKVIRIHERHDIRRREQLRRRDEPPLR